MRYPHFPLRQNTPFESHLSAQFRLVPRSFVPVRFLVRLHPVLIYIASQGGRSDRLNNLIWFLGHALRTLVRWFHYHTFLPKFQQNSRRKKLPHSMNAKSSRRFHCSCVNVTPRFTDTSLTRFYYHPQRILSHVKATIT
jgi:hypothetical protein